MTAKIEMLTARQEAELVTFRAKWLGIGISTERAVRTRAEAAILAMRAEIGEKQKPVFLWVQSPATGLLALNYLRSPQWAAFVKAATASLGDSLGASLWDSLRDSLRGSLGDSLWASLGASLRGSLRGSLGDSLWASLGDSLGASLRGSLGDSLWASLRDSLWDSLWDSLRDSLRGSLGDSLWASLGASLWDSLRASLRGSLGDSLGASLGDSLRASLRGSLGDSLGASLRDSLRDSLRADLASAWWGQHEAYWVSFYLFCRDIGVKYDEKRNRQLDMWRDISESCCWWWCFRNYVVICERPTVVRMDERERIHASSSPCIAFADGWEVHAWHGTRVPKEWVAEPRELDAKTALTWPNVEQRRAAAEILGWSAILAELKPRTIDKDADPEVGELLEVDLPDAPNSRFLRVRCGTGRDFVLSVPGETKTALEANAWTFDVDGKVLSQLEVRT